MPKVTARSNSHYGNVSSQYFKRLGLPFHIYDLRHAHAGRMALKGIDPSIAARSQGHSLKVHSEIYLNFLNADNRRTLFRPAIKTSDHLMGYLPECWKFIDSLQPK